jgi:hypothetical protein
MRNTLVLFFFGQVDPFRDNSVKLLLPIQHETNTYFENICIELNMTNISSSSYIKHINTLSCHSKKAKVICLEYFKRKLFHFDYKNQKLITLCDVLILNMTINYMGLYIANIMYTIPGPIAFITCFVTSISVNAVICRKHHSTA